KANLFAFNFFMKKLRLTLCAVFCVLITSIVPASLQAQRTVFTGTLLGTDQQALDGATVTYRGENRSDSGSVIADYKGQFSIRLLQHTKYTLQVSSVGYNRLSRTVSVDGKAISRTFFLT